MFDHVEIRVTDREASERFYATVLAPLGVEQTTAGDWLASGTTSRSRPAATGKPRDARGCTSAFARPRASEVDEFWQRRHGGRLPRRRRAGRARRSTRPTTTAASCSTPTATAPRPSTTAGAATAGHIDHLWIRVARRRGREALLRDHRAATPACGWAPTRRTRAQFARGERLVLARPRRHADRARAPRVPRDRRRDRRRLPPRGASAAGYRDNGAPGERPATTPATTAPSCSTPTATTSRSSTTTTTSFAPGPRAPPGPRGSPARRSPRRPGARPSPPGRGPRRRRSARGPKRRSSSWSPSISPWKMCPPGEPEARLELARAEREPVDDAVGQRRGRPRRSARSRRRPPPRRPTSGGKHWQNIDSTWRPGGRERRVGRRLAGGLDPGPRGGRARRARRPRPRARSSSV